MMKIALTGGIGTGKSTVARMFHQCGIPIVDADKIVHTMYEDPKIIAMLTVLFGREINESGKINRRKLGEIIFSDAQKKAELDAFFKTRVIQAANDLFQSYESQGTSCVVYDAALIYEWGIESHFDEVVVVDAPLELRIMRICARDGMDEIAARKRIDAQMPLADKVARADYVIENDGDFKKLQHQCFQFIETVKSRL